MRVFAKKAFQFTQYGEKDGMKVVVQTATTSPLQFCDLPDWVDKDPMFGWAKADGDIELIQTKADEKEAELNAEVKSNKTKSEKVAAVK